jgi:hypothetical protein
LREAVDWPVDYEALVEELVVARMAVVKVLVQRAVETVVVQLAAATVMAH